jgi:hypothetical protein
MTNMDVFLTGVPAGAIGVSDGFDDSPSARTILVLYLTALDDEVDDVPLDCLREAFVIFVAPVKNTDFACGAVCVKLIIISYVCILTCSNA